MTSLYDLLGAHASDDAATLKKAFRNAVKAHHPDLHPDDPDASSRFREIIAANALLRDAKQRATYDRLIDLEHQQFQWKLEHQRRQSEHDRRQIRSKRTRTTVAVAVVGALAGGYGLFAPKATITAIVAVKGQKHAETAGASVKTGAQTATVATAPENDGNAPTAVATAEADAVKGDLTHLGEPVETAAAKLTGDANPTDHDAPRRMPDGAGVPGGAIGLSATASETSGREIPDLARELALAPPSSNANFHRELGIAFYRSGDFPQAIANFDEAIRLDPGDARAYNIRGNVWDDKGEFERALADYDSAIHIDPNNPAAFHDRAILWQRQGALDKALVDLDRAIRFSFADANMYCDRGLVWYEKGRHDRAIADFNQAIRLDPDSAAACISRGLIWHRSSDFKVADAGKAIRVDPNVFDATRRPNLRP